MQKFLNKFVNKNTRNVYQSSLIHFFDFLKQNPDKWIIDVRRIQDVNDKIDALDNYEEDINRYWQHLLEQNTPPQTCNNSIKVVRLFLTGNRIDLPIVFWKELKQRGNGNATITEDKKPTKEQLKTICEHADIRVKTMLLVLSSSGMRIGEALQFTPDDIEFGTPTKITIKHNGKKTTKNKKTRYVFISNEATETLKEWLKVRDDYFERALKHTPPNPLTKEKILKNPDDKRVFPFSEYTFREAYLRVLTKIGLDIRDTNGRYIYHIHVMRKYFKSNLGKKDTALAERLMGHNGYLGENYDRLEPEEVAQLYLENVGTLTIYESQEVVDVELEINRRVTQQVTQMENDILAKLKEHLEWGGDISFNPDPYKEG